MKTDRPDHPLRVCAIIAFGENGELGKKNGLPWGRSLAKDLAHFKATTSTRSLLMGSKTAESLGRPLPNRDNYVLSSRPEALASGFIHTASIDTWKELLISKEEKVGFIIGGATLLEEAFKGKHIHRMYLTRVLATFHGSDCHFPDINWEEWKLIVTSSYPADNANLYPTKYEVWERKDCLV